MLDINRRNAFAHSFVQFPDFLKEFAKHCFGVSTDMRTEFSPEQIFEIPGVMHAQFAVRMIQTRARGSGNAALQSFAGEMAQRYAQVILTPFLPYSINAPVKYLEAINSIMSGMSSLILQALATEAELDTKANGSDKPLIPFDEADFWKDVFLSFIQNWRPGYCQPAKPLQVVFLDHIEDFKAALIGPQ